MLFFHFLIFHHHGSNDPIGRCCVQLPEALAMAWGKAWREVQILRSNGAELNVFHFGSQLRRAKGEAMWSSAGRMLEEMQTLQVQLNDVILNTAIDIHGKGSQWTYAFHLLDGMPQDAMQPDIIGACACASSLRAAAGWRRAMQMLAEMTKVLCNAVLSVMEVQWRAALWMFQWSLSKMSLDTISYSAVLGAYASSGLWIQSFQLMKIMAQRKVLCDLIAWNTAANSWAQTGSLWLMALRSLLTLRQQRLGPSVVSITSTMNTCHKGTAWPMAVAVHSSSPLRTAASSNCLLSAIARGILWRAALWHHTADVDATGRTAILESVGAAAQWQRSLTLATLGRLDAVGFNAVLSILESAKQWRYCVEVLETMQKTLMKLSVSSYSPLLSRDGALLLEMRACQVPVDTLALSFAVDGNEACDMSTLRILAELQSLALQGLGGSENFFGDSENMGSVRSSADQHQRWVLRHWKQPTSICHKTQYRRRAITASSPMCSVFSAMSGERLAVVDDYEGKTGKQLKQAVAAQTGFTRFRQKVLSFDVHSEVEDDQILTSECEKLQLVLLDFLPPDVEKDQKMCDAAKENQVATLETLLKSPRSPNAEVDGSVSLHFAAFNGHKEAIWLLLEARAETDVRNSSEQGLTPLLLATQSGQVDAVRFLIEAGANPSLATLDDLGATPLQVAAEQGLLDIVQLLIQAGVDVNKALPSDGRTALYAAAQFDRVAVVSLLLESRADMQKALTIGTTGATPSYIAAHQGNVEVLRALLEHRADVNQATADDGFTLLHIASQEGHDQVVRLLQRLLICCLRLKPM
eukprot:s926_g9.t1